MPVAAAAVTAAAVLPFLVKRSFEDRITSAHSAIEQSVAAFAAGKPEESRNTLAHASNLLGDLAAECGTAPGAGVTIANELAFMTCQLLSQQRGQEAADAVKLTFRIANGVAQQDAPTAASALKAYLREIAGANQPHAAFVIGQEICRIIQEYAKTTPKESVGWEGAPLTACQQLTANAAFQVKEYSAAKALFTAVRDAAIHSDGPDCATAKEARNELKAVRQATYSTTTHTIERGENFRTIAAKLYGSSELAGILIAANPTTSPTKLRAGDSLVVPDAAWAKEEHARTKYYRTPCHAQVQQGDTLFSLAARLCGGSNEWPKLLALNPALTREGVSSLVGQTVRIRSEFGEPDPSLQESRRNAVLMRPVAVPTPTPKALTNETQSQFINQLAAPAVQIEREFGIPAPVLIAQAALESGWGRRALPGNNLFGIKATPDWQGGRQSHATHEVEAGRRVATRADFRTYPSLTDCLRDYAAFLARNSRYQAAFCHSDPVAFAGCVAAAGYATDPQYAAKLAQVMRDYVQR